MNNLSLENEFTNSEEANKLFGKCWNKNINIFDVGQIISINYNNPFGEIWAENINIFEVKEIVNTGLDNVLFEDFKNKLSQEELDNFDDSEDLEESEYLEDFSEYNNSKYDKSIKLEDVVEDYKNGISEAFDYIYFHYKKILERLGRRNNNEDLGLELLDIVLLNAVNTFDKNGGTKFNTYFWACAKNYINCYKIKTNAKKRACNKNMLSLNEKKHYKGNDSELELEKIIKDDNASNSFEYNELKQSIMALKDCLKEKEIIILLRLIDNYTLQEIGEELNITAPAVCMALKRIAKKPIAAKKLRQILTNCDECI